MNNNATFPCIFLFNIFFILHNFAMDFAVFTMWLQMDGLTGKWMDQWMDRPMEEWNSGWTNIPPYKDAMYTSKNDDFLTDFAIFTKALWTDAPTDQRTNGLMDQQTYPLIEM